MKNLFWLCLPFVISCQNLPHKHTRGGDTEKVIREYEAQNQAAKECYREHLQQHSGLQARIGLRWQVGSNGQAQKIEVIEDTLLQPSISRCLIEHLKTVRFDSQGDFTHPTVSYVYKLENRIDSSR